MKYITKQPFTAKAYLILKSEAVYSFKNLVQSQYFYDNLVNLNSENKESNRNNKSLFFLNPDFSYYLVNHNVS